MFEYDEGFHPAVPWRNCCADVDGPGFTTCEDCAVLNKPVFYVAHPVSGDIEANLANVIKWIAWLTDNDRSRVYIAPWVAEVMAFKDRGEISPEFYDRVLADDMNVVNRLDGILLVGGTVSRGMALERDAALVGGKTVQDWSEYRTPSDLPQHWVEALGCQ